MINYENIKERVGVRMRLSGDEIEWGWFRESLAVIFDNKTVVLKMTFIDGTAKGRKAITSSALVIW